MSLTAKREVFCQGVADGLNYSDAYRLSHDASRMKPAVLHEEASRLAAVPDVSLRIEQLKLAQQARLAEKHDWSQDKLIHEAETNLHLATISNRILDCLRYGGSHIS